jgi:hypothetical protein
MMQPGTVNHGLGKQHQIDIIPFAGAGRTGVAKTTSSDRDALTGATYSASRGILGLTHDQRPRKLGESLDYKSGPVARG